MKRTIAVALAAITFGGFARADFSLSTDITFATDYIFRGMQYGSNTLHPSIEFNADNFYAGMWAALPINDRGSQGWSDEYDFYLGFTPELSDTVSLDVGLTHYYYPTGDSTLEAFVGASTDMGGLTPSLYLYHDFDLKNTTIQGAVGYSIPMESLGASLDLSGTLGHVDVDDGDSYMYYGVSAVVPYKLNDNATFTVGLHWVSNDLDMADVDDSWVYATVGLTIGF